MTGRSSVDLPPLPAAPTWADPDPTDVDTRGEGASVYWSSPTTTIGDDLELSISASHTLACDDWIVGDGDAPEIHVAGHSLTVDQAAEVVTELTRLIGLARSGRPEDEERSYQSGMDALVSGTVEP